MVSKAVLWMPLPNTLLGARGRDFALKIKPLLRVAFLNIPLTLLFVNNAQKKQNQRIRVGFIGYYRVRQLVKSYREAEPLKQTSKDPSYWVRAQSPLPSVHKKNTSWCICAHERGGVDEISSNPPLIIVSHNRYLVKHFVSSVE